MARDNSITIIYYIYKVSYLISLRQCIPFVKPFVSNWAWSLETILNCRQRLVLFRESDCFLIQLQHPSQPHAWPCHSVWFWFSFWLVSICCLCWLGCLILSWNQWWEYLSGYQLLSQSVSEPLLTVSEPSGQNLQRLGKPAKVRMPQQYCFCIKKC